MRSTWSSGIASSDVAPGTRGREPDAVDQHQRLAAVRAAQEDAGQRAGAAVHRDLDARLALHELGQALRAERAIVAASITVTSASTSAIGCVPARSGHGVRIGQQGLALPVCARRRQHEHERRDQARTTRSRGARLTMTAETATMTPSTAAARPRAAWVSELPSAKAARELAG
jgi:hypothetical protein